MGDTGTRTQPLPQPCHTPPVGPRPVGFGCRVPSFLFLSTTAIQDIVTPHAAAQRTLSNSETDQSSIQCTLFARGPLLPGLEESPDQPRRPDSSLGPWVSICETSASCPSATCPLVSRGGQRALAVGCCCAAAFLVALTWLCSRARFFLQPESHLMCSLARSTTYRVPGTS